MTEQRIADWSALGALVKHTRREKGMTQQSLSERADVSRAWLARFESGHRTAELEQVLRALTALDLDLVARPSRLNEEEAELVQALAKRRPRNRGQRPGGS